MSVYTTILDVSDRLIECFSEAGLPEPQLFSETLVGGGTDSPLYAWAAETLKGFRPQLAEMGIALGELIGIETLESSRGRSPATLWHPLKSTHGSGFDHRLYR